MKTAAQYLAAYAGSAALALAAIAALPFAIIGVGLLMLLPGEPSDYTGR